MEIVLSAASKRNLRAFLASPNGSYIFSGPEAIGKRTSALAVAAKLKIEPSNVISLEPDGKSIGIDAIHDLRRKLYFKGTGKGLRLAIIDDAHMLTTEAQNALLKTLEEPNEHVCIVLITHSLHKLLPTIISRCKLVKFAMPESSEVLTFLDKNYPNSPLSSQQLLQFAGGRIGNAIKLASDSEQLVELQQLHQEVINYAKHDLFEKLKATPMLSDNTQDFIQTLLRALAAARRKALENANYTRARRLNAMCLSCVSLLEYLEHNGNSKLALDRLAVEMSV